MADTILGEWIFSTTVGPAPASGQIRMDNAAQSSATKVWVHKSDANGTDASAVLTTLKLGYRINLQIKTDTTKSQTYNITGTPVDQSTYMEYPVAWLSGDQPLSGQRATLTSVSVPITITVPSTVALLSQIGTPVIRLAPNAVVAGQQMQASCGAVATVTTKNVAVAVLGTGVEAQTGSVAGWKLGMAVQIANVPPMVAQVGSPTEVKGYVLLDGYAFPSNTPFGYSPGMTRRQWYASQAMVGFIANAPATNLIDRVAPYCFKLADTMLEFEAKEKLRLPAVPVPAPPQAPPPQTAPISVSPLKAVK